MNLFGIKRVSPEERMKLWRRELKRQEREIERSIRDIDREEAKVVMECKRTAKRGENTTVRILARQIVQSRRAKERLYNSKAHLSSISLTLTQQMATVKVTGTMARSAKVMESMNRLVRVEQISKTMEAMAREMEKAGLIEEMTKDIFEDDEIEEEADAEVEKIMDEITAGLTAVRAPTDALPVPTPVPTQADTALQARLNALGS